MNYKDGVRVLILIQRKKENEKMTTKDKHLKHIITTNEKEFDIAFENLKKECVDKNYRIYSTANKRNFEKAVRRFKQLQLDNDYSLEKNLFYLDVRNRFLSCLMKPESRDETIFKFDVDTKDNDKCNEVIRELSRETEIICERETKNGFHYFTKPFNHNLVKFSFKVDFSKDGLILLYF